MSEVKALTDLLHLLRDDSYAITFQSTGQYRTALINEVRRKIRGLECDAVTGNAEPKFHYYSFAFAFGSSQASVYIGYDDMAVTWPRIEAAKKSAGVIGTAALLSCCYLGHMSRAEMVGGES